MKTLQGKVDVMQAWEDGAGIEFRSAEEEQWKPISDPSWNWGMYDYRAKEKLVEVKEQPKDEQTLKSRSKEYYTNMLKLLQAESIPISAPSELLPFDLEAAKAGAPIMRRNGEKMRFIAFDEKLKYPVLVARVRPEGDTERPGEPIYTYPKTGSHGHRENFDADLVMAPVPVKECKCWVNLYKTSMGEIFTSEVCETPKECAAILSKYETYLGICPVTWTEKV